MLKISDEARSRIHKHGKNVRAIEQGGVPFQVGIGVPVVNPFVEKRLVLKTEYRLTGVELEEVREGLMFGDFRPFWDMKLDEFDRAQRRRHFAINPFTKLMEESLGGPLGRLGVAMAHGIANSMVAMLGLVEWEMVDATPPGADEATIRIAVTSRFFRGHIVFRVRREDGDVVVVDDWLPEDGGDMRTSTLPMANVVLTTHPFGFQQVVERVVDEIVHAHQRHVPYRGEVDQQQVA